VLAALVAWNLGNYVFYLIAGRALGPEDFGLAAALLAVTVIASVPGNALQYGIARSVAAPAVALGGMPSAVYRRAWRLSLAIAGAAGAIVAVGIVAVGAVADDVAVGPLLLTLLIVLPMGPLFLSLGQLQGERRYRGYAVTFALWGVPRPLVLIPLALLGLGVYAALGATAAALVAAAAVGAFLTASRLRGPRDAPAADWRTFTRALPPVVAGLTGVAFLTNLDVVAAKLALADHDAGYFGAEAVLGKAVIVVPQALSIVLLPRVAARRAEGGDTGRILALAVVITLAVGGLVALACLPLAEPITRIAFGGEYVPGAGLLAPLVAASTLLGLAILLVAHHSARADHRFLWAVGVVAVLQVALLLMFHDSGAEIVVVDLVAGAGVLVAHELIHGGSDDGIARGLVRLVRGRSAPPAGEAAA
jgi:O-antigen/teichoic acid export membrane protein